jgi:hypothetical protein
LILVIEDNNNRGFSRLMYVNTETREVSFTDSSQGAVLPEKDFKKLLEETSRDTKFKLRGVL